MAGKRRAARPAGSRSGARHWVCREPDASGQRDDCGETLVTWHDHAPKCPLHQVPMRRVAD